MTDDTKKPGGSSIEIAPGSSERAPFIYFDGAASYGVNQGIIQLELVAMTIVLDGPKTKTEAVVTAHLRCTRTAAALLCEAINKTLAMSGGPAEPREPIPFSKQN